ncbi:Putative zinc-finger [Geodermatophilus telluris]|uniref:Putative zinc-finger n=1 Tax=Geodermatophilus telluris TaxID=1190417 RepID=A0A1G6NWA9_9ACTN|nr:zf-HC2 domain-containing protein [Geodermatophilus telluris]SDC71536.1 Putative zinc-finger [Geodermatophilus telluris]
MVAENPAPAPRAAADDVLEVACQEFVELVTEHLEGALPEPVDRAVRAHLELCDPCVVYLEQVRSTAAALRTLPLPTLPAAARERLLDVFTALHGDPAEGGTGSS